MTPLVTRLERVTQRGCVDKHRPVADMVLTRIALPRWNVIQYWLRLPEDRPKDLVRGNVAATSMPASIEAALRTARITTWKQPPDKILDHAIDVREDTDRSIRDAIAAADMFQRYRAGDYTRSEGLWLPNLGGTPYHDAHLVGFELTGSRLSAQKRYERAKARGDS